MPPHGYLEEARASHGYLDEWLDTHDNSNVERPSEQAIEASRASTMISETPIERMNRDILELGLGRAPTLPERLATPQCPNQPDMFELCGPDCALCIMRSYGPCILVDDRECGICHLYIQPHHMSDAVVDYEAMEYNVPPIVIKTHCHRSCHDTPIHLQGFLSCRNIEQPTRYMIFGGGLTASAQALDNHLHRHLHDGAWHDGMGPGGTQLPIMPPGQVPIMPPGGSQIAGGTQPDIMDGMAPMTQ